MRSVGDSWTHKYYRKYHSEHAGVYSADLRLQKHLGSLDSVSAAAKSSPGGSPLLVTELTITTLIELRIELAET